MQQSESTYDAFGEAIEAYFSGEKDSVVKVVSSITEDDVIPAAYLFREFNDMPEGEQIALGKSTGRVLDVGAGAGSHVLWLQERGIPAVALEISEKAVEVMKKRGVTEAIQTDLWYYKPTDKFDTILLLMNGLGLAGTLEKLPGFLELLKSWLKPSGEIFVESADIWYMFENEDGSVSFDLNGPYYGEVTYQMVFKGEGGKPFPWLFLDPASLEDYAISAGFKVDFLYENDNFQYLARLRKID
jgi:SAM-dependent methyltransferase